MLWRRVPPSVVHTAMLVEGLRRRSARPSAPFRPELPPRRASTKPSRRGRPRGRRGHRSSSSAKCSLVEQGSCGTRPPSPSEVTTSFIVLIKAGAREEGEARPLHLVDRRSVRRRARSPSSGSSEKVTGTSPWTSSSTCSIHDSGNASGSSASHISANASVQARGTTVAHWYLPPPVASQRPPVTSCASVELGRRLPVRAVERRSWASGSVRCVSHRAA